MLKSNKNYYLNKIKTLPQNYLLPLFEPYRDMIRTKTIQYFMHFIIWFRTGVEWSTHSWFTAKSHRWVVLDTTYTHFRQWKHLSERYENKYNVHEWNWLDVHRCFWANLQNNQGCYIWVHSKFSDISTTFPWWNIIFPWQFPLFFNHWKKNVMAILPHTQDFWKAKA